MKKYFLFMLYWGSILFSVLAQISEKFIIWLEPYALSMLDARMDFTFGPVILNYFLLYMLKKAKTNRFLLIILIVINTLFFIYYFYYQFIWNVTR